MAQNIKLNSTEWCDLVFDGKNKGYGAYQLRKSSSKRHIVAFVATVFFVGVVAAIPAFLDAVKSQNENLGGIDDVFVIANLDPAKNEIPEQNIIEQELAPPPPPVLATMIFTPPTIVEDTQVDEAREMHTINELQESNLAISSVENLHGSTAPDAVDPADLFEHQQVVEAPKVEKPFESVEQPPQFQGGDVELMRYLNSNIKYPAVAAENGIQGQVVLRFVVNKEGGISDVEVLKTLDASCDREAIRVVKSMPRWIPGMQNGRNVPVYYTLPVRFKLQ